MAEFKLKGVTSLALKVGEKQEVEVEGLDAKVLLVNAGGTIQAIGPKCTHYGAPLVKGVLTAAGRITCPWHGGKRGPLSSVVCPLDLSTLTRFSLLQCQDGRRRGCAGAGLPADLSGGRAGRSRVRDG